MEATRNTELLHKGAEEFITENYNSAADTFTQLLSTNTENFSAYLYRGSSYLKLRRFSDAITDFDAAQKLNENSFEVFYKRGIAYFLLENYIESNDNFRKALALSENSEQRDKLIIWTNKLDIELVERNLKSKITDTTAIKFIHSWFQTATHVILTLECNSEITSDEFNFTLDKKLISVRNTNTNVFEMNIANSIVPDQSSFTIKKNKIEFKLKKEIENFNWVTVDRKNVEEQSNAFIPSYPTSSKTKKNWDNLEKEITKELQEDVKKDPNEGMMSLFRQIYERGDENTRRAMIKSMQTSGGTVLSTNWGEVSDKDYEGKDRPEPPKGQEWRKN